MNSDGSKDFMDEYRESLALAARQGRQKILEGLGPCALCGHRPMWKSCFYDSDDEDMVGCSGCSMFVEDPDDWNRRPR